LPVLSHAIDEDASTLISGFDFEQLHCLDSYIIFPIKTIGDQVLKSTRGLVFVN
jgi:hypothetical protein